MEESITQFKSKVKRLSKDEETIRIYELREKKLSDTKTQINGTKREIAKRILKSDHAISISEVAELTELSIEEVEELEREVR